MFIYVSACNLVGWSCLAWNCISSGKFNQIIPVPGVVIEPRYLSQTNQRRLISGVTNTPIESTSISGSSTLKTTVNSKSTNNSFHQYSRVTIPIDDMTEAQRLNASNPVLNQFDIVAVVPGNYKVFSYCCRTADVDLISIDFAHRVPYVLDKKLVSEIRILWGCCCGYIEPILLLKFHLLCCLAHPSLFYCLIFSCLCIHVYLAG